MVRVFLSFVAMLAYAWSALADGVADADAGIARLEAHDPRAAVDLFTRAIQSRQLSDETLALTYHRRGMAFYMQGEAGRAILDYTLALWHEDLPKEFRPRTLNNRGLAFESLNQYESAIRDYNLSIRLNPNYAEAYANRGNLRRRFNQHAEAVQDYDMALQSDHPRKQFVLMWQGLAMEGLGKRREAAESFRQALQIDADLQDARVHLARVQETRLLSNAVTRKKLPSGTGGPFVSPDEAGAASRSQTGAVGAWAPPTPSDVKTGPATPRATGDVGTIDGGLRLGTPSSVDTPEPQRKATRPASEMAAPPVSGRERGTGGLAGNAYGLQLGSFASASLANSGWDRLGSSARGLLDGLDRDVQRVDLPGRGAAYRLVAGGLPDKASAAKLCRALRDAGSACVVVKR